MRIKGLGCALIAALLVFVSSDPTPAATPVPHPLYRFVSTIHGVISKVWINDQIPVTASVAEECSVDGGRTWRPYTSGNPIKVFWVASGDAATAMDYLTIAMNDIQWTCLKRQVDWQVPLEPRTFDRRYDEP